MGRYSPRSSRAQHAVSHLRASKQIATDRERFALRQLEGECERPRTRSKPFEGRNAEHARGPRLAIVGRSFTASLLGGAYFFVVMLNLNLVLLPLHK